MNMELASTAGVKSRAFLFSSPETFRKSQTANPKQLFLWKSRVSLLVPETRNSKPEMSTLGYHAFLFSSPKTFRKPENRNSEPETRNPTSETRNLNPEA